MKCYLFLTTIFVLFIFPCFAQTKNRLIHLDNDEDVEESRQIVKITRLEAGNNEVRFNQEFAAQDDWIKTLKIRVKNVGKKPIVYIGVGFGLLDTVDGELESGASYQYGISFDAGKPIENIKKKKSAFMLNPSKEADLVYKGVSRDYKNVLEKVGIGRFHKAKFMVIRVQFIDGEFIDTQNIQ
jgi:hypothetical protein